MTIPWNRKIWRVLTFSFHFYIYRVEQKQDKYVWLYLYKNKLCSRPQPIYIPNRSGGWHIDLGVKHVGDRIRVTLTSLHDISSTSAWILAKVTRIHQWKIAKGQLGCMTLTSFSRSRHDWNSPKFNWIVLLCILSYYAISEFAPKFLCMYHWDKVKHLWRLYDLDLIFKVTRKLKLSFSAKKCLSDWYI